MPIFESIPDFGQYIEYITQAAPVQQGDGLYYGLEFHHLPVAKDGLDLDDDGTMDLRIREIFQDYIKVFRILARDLDLTLAELNNMIPERIRLRLNIWLMNRGWPTIPVGTTWKQLLVAIRNRVRV